MARFVSDREHVLVQTRAHTAVLGGAVALATAAVGLLSLAVAALDRHPRAGVLGTVVLLAAGVLVAAAVGRLALRVWEWDRTVLAVTEERVLVVRCALRRHTHSVPLAGVERLRVRQSVTGRLLGYGTIVLENADRRSRLAYVPRPDRVSALISAQTGRARPGEPA